LDRTGPTILITLTLPTILRLSGSTGPASGTGPAGRTRPASGTGPVSRTRPANGTRTRPAAAIAIAVPGRLLASLSEPTAPR
jgi:hypothetical protein